MPIFQVHQNDLTFYPYLSTIPPTKISRYRPRPVRPFLHLFSLSKNLNPLVLKIKPLITILHNTPGRQTSLPPPSFQSHTVGGDRLMLEPRLSCGPVLECRRIGRPPPGVPPGELAQDGAIRILGVISVLSDSRRLVNVLATRRKLLSAFADDVEPNHQEPSMPVQYGCVCV